MATQPEDEVDDFEEKEVEQPDDDGQETETEQEDEPIESVTFDDDEASEAEEDSPPIRKMRKMLAEANKKVRQYEQQRPPAPVEPDIVVGDMPDMDDFWEEGDPAAAFKAATHAWIERRDKAAEQKRGREDAERTRKSDWQRVQNNYLEQKSRLTFDDVQDAEDIAFGDMNEVQQAVVGKYAKQPALLVYALGKSPAKLAAFTAEHDPIKLGQLIVAMEANLKTSKRVAPEPDTPLRGRAPVAASTKDKHQKELDRMEKAFDAGQGGDRSKIREFKRLHGL